MEAPWQFLDESQSWWSYSVLWSACFFPWGTTSCHGHQTRPTTTTMTSHFYRLSFPPPEWDGRMRLIHPWRRCRRKKPPFINAPRRHVRMSPHSPERPPDKRYLLRLTKSWIAFLFLLLLLPCHACLSIQPNGWMQVILDWATRACP